MDDHPHGARTKGFMDSQRFEDFTVVLGEFNKSKVKAAPQQAASPFVGTGTALPRSQPPDDGQETPAGRGDEDMQELDDPYLDTLMDAAKTLDKQTFME
eukprot:4764923-Pyramimonas_sp.AAC.1